MTRRDPLPLRIGNPIPRLVWLLLAASMLLGCEPRQADGPADVTRVTVDNKTDGVVREFVVAGLGEPMRFRPLSGGSETRLTPSNGRASQPLSVRWIDKDGRQRTIRVKLDERLHKGYQGPITLTLWRQGRLGVTAG